MRPDVLNPLFAPVTSLAGIGPKLGELLQRLLVGGDGPDVRVADLLFHLPASVVDRSRQPAITEAAQGSVVTLKVMVDRHAKAPRNNPRVPYRVYARDDTGEIALTFFHAHAEWLEKTLPVGRTVYVSGKMDWFNGRPSMIHPDHIVSEAELATLPLIEPVYPMTAGLSPKVLVRAVGDALGRVPALAEWNDTALLRQREWPTFGAALLRAHRPEGGADVDPASPHRTRLAYDELLANQLAIALMREHQRRSTGQARRGNGRFTDGLRAALPFRLTQSQETAIADIVADLGRRERMLRLLQGDVGSGKTVVALFAAATAIEAGGQVAMMAPTELLVRQHARTIAPLADAAGISVTVLTGREKGREREAVLAGLADGSTNLVIGTHALFQSGVAFADLALAVVDEQHRFGVHQRLSLTDKGGATDVLVMTATPIPRTLVLTYYGDMDVSKLTEKPAGRQPIETRALPTSRLDQVVARIETAIASGAKAYWVCPLVAESEELDVAAAEERYAALRDTLGDVVGLVHGQMAPAQRDAVMARFAGGPLKVLVATTVIEVGVDVPDATIMVIEHAERFGLAQLHQLRGRVGRGDKPSACLLLYKPPLGDVAKQRLEVLRETDDGFRIADEDLRLRGGGEVLGTRQSGMPGFRIAEDVHLPLMDVAHDDARLIVATDPKLRSPRGEALRVLLYLFGRDEAVRLLGAG